jgi:hypothetical protein
MKVAQSMPTQKDYFFGLQNLFPPIGWQGEKNFSINFQIYDLANGKE